MSYDRHSDHTGDGETGSPLRTPQAVPVSLFFTLILVLNLYAPAEPTFTERVLATAIILIAYIPTGVWLAGRDSRVPFMPFFSGIYAVYYAFPIFLRETYSRAAYFGRQIADESVESTLLFCLIGLIVLFVGYYGRPTRRLFALLPRAGIQWSDHSAVQLIGMALGLIGLCSYYLESVAAVPLNISQFVRYISEGTLFSMAMLLVLQLDAKLTFSGKVFLWGFLFPCRIALGMASGRAAQALEVLLLLLFVYSAMRRSLPIKLMALACLALIVMLPVRTELRTVTWASDSRLTPYDKTLIYGTTVWNVLTGDKPLSESFQATASRMDALMTFAEVVELTPSVVPYYYGETYYPMLFKPIPRFLYPNKPMEDTGQTFGHRYQFLNATDLTTTYNLPQLVEFYANFGFAGVCLGMLISGVLFRAIQHVFVHTSTGLGAIVACTYTFTRLTGMESSFSMVFGGLLWGLVYVLSIHGLMLVLSRKRVFAVPA